MIMIDYLFVNYVPETFKGSPLLLSRQIIKRPVVKMLSTKGANMNSIWRFDIAISNLFFL